MKKILVVEDSPTQVEQLQNLLKAQDYEVQTACNGKEALATVQSFHPDIILSDVIMPEMNGYAFCDAVKADENLRDIPVILVTALSSPEDIIQSLQCGADSFIRKPYDAHYLLSRIQYLLINKEHRPRERVKFGIEIYLLGKKYFINSGQQQILDLLISTYEEAVHLNQELVQKGQELSRSYQSLNGVYKIAKSLLKEIHETDIAETTLSKVLEIPDIGACWIHLNGKGPDYRLLGAVGFPDEFDLKHLIKDRCSCLKRFSSGEEDLKLSLMGCELLSSAGFGTFGACYHIPIPLSLNKPLEGVLNLVGTSAECLSQEQITLLEGIGYQLSVALEKAHLYEHLEEEVEERTIELQQEIAEHKRTAKALSLSEFKFRTLAEFAASLEFWMNPNFTFYYIGEASDLITGYKTEEFYNSPRLFFDIIAPQDRERIEAFFRINGKKGGNQDIEYRLTDKNKNMRWVSLSYRPIFDEKGTDLGWRGSILDITERKQLEAELLQSQKMEVLSQVVGGLAHDFNNLLSVINGYATLGIKELPSTNKSYGYFENISHAGEQASNFIKKLLTFAKRHERQPKIINLGERLAEMKPLLKSVLTEKIHLNLKAGETPSPIDIDPAELEQVILNLVVNAKDAIADGGEVNIETAHFTLEETRPYPLANLSPGTYVVLTIHDTGTGMTPETFAHIYEPFFTTKKEKGTGLGLSVTYGIVQQAGGIIVCNSEANKGTTFQIYFPLAAEETILKAA